MTFYIQATIEDVQINAESDTTTVGAGYGNVEIDGLGDLVVSTKPISERTDGKGNNSSYLCSYKLHYYILLISLHFKEIFSL